MSDPEMAAQYALKSALRKSMNKTLRALSEQELTEQSSAVTRHLLSQPFFQRARTVGCYLSMAKGELRTDDIVSTCLEQGKKLYIPYLPPAASSTAQSGLATTEAPKPLPDTPAVMHMLRLYSKEDLQACPLDKWGLVDPGTGRKDVDASEDREDVMSPEAADLDLILIPGVAFDEECNRLGRGKAYYDRFLAQYTSTRKSPLLVALALTPQILPSPDRIPTTPHDFQLDAVLSPQGLSWRGGCEPTEG